MGEDFSEATKGIPGVWTHMSTFLSGPRSCIGYRFALAEYVEPLPFFSHLFPI
jgi:cytochrome P450